MPLVPSRSLGFLQRKQLVSRAAQLRYTSGSARPTLPGLRFHFLRVLALRIPETFLHSGNFD